MTKVFLVIIALVAATFAFFQFAPPIPQDPSYHLYADDRTLFGIPNFSDVASNSLFLVAGFLGLTAIQKRSLTISKQSVVTFQVFFAGLVAVAVFSSYYHLEPINKTLALDRLGLSIVFAGFTCIIVSDFFSETIARRLVAPLVIVSACTVLYWYYSETVGQGDLRPYGLVQFFPMVAIPFVLLFAKSSYTKASLYWLVLALYGLAKIFEISDSAIYANFVISGHTLKHLTSALAPFVVLRMLSIRDRNSAQVASGE